MRKLNAMITLERIFENLDAAGVELNVTMG
jgi:hypothetical protein